MWMHLNSYCQKIIYHSFLKSHNQNKDTETTVRSISAGLWSVGKNFQYAAVIFFICPSNHSPLTAPRLFVHVNSLASSSKVMWKFTNSPPAAFPLKSILCQKHKMSTGNFSPLLLDLEVCACWQGRWRVCLCVRDRKKKVQLCHLLFSTTAPKWKYWRETPASSVIVFKALGNAARMFLHILS